MTSVHQLRSFGIAAVAYHCQWVADDDDDEQEDDDYGDEYDDDDENDDNYYDDDQLQSFGVAGVFIVIVSTTKLWMNEQEQNDKNPFENF